MGKEEGVDLGGVGKYDQNTSTKFSNNNKKEISDLNNTGHGKKLKVFLSESKLEVLLP